MKRAILATPLLLLTAACGATVSDPEPAPRALVAAAACPSPTPSAGATRPSLQRQVDWLDCRVKALEGGNSSPSVTPSVPSVSSTPGRATISISSGVPWAATAYTNTPIPPAPKTNDAETAVVRSLAQSILNNEAYTEPVYYAGTTPMRPVTCTLYPCVGGLEAPVRGDEVVASGTDGQLVIVDLERRRSFELYAVKKDPDGTVALPVSAGSMSVVDLDGPGNATADGKRLNITGAGLSRMFGLIRAHEIQAAKTNPATAIPHGLQVALPPTKNCAGTYRAPATKTDGRGTGACVQEGARIQMDPAFDCGTLTVQLGKAVCHALQKYGAYVMDNAGNTSLVFYGQHRVSWGTGAADYAAVGINSDYAGLGIPLARLRVLARWDGG